MTLSPLQDKFGRDLKLGSKILTLRFFEIELKMSDEEELNDHLALGIAPLSIR